MKTKERLPSFFDVIEEGDESACRTLWLSVILQQILDARGKFGNWVTEREAQIWLEGRGGSRSDFAEVCRLAGVDFVLTRQRCAEILADSSITIDFRVLKQDKENGTTTTGSKRYFRRVAKNKRLRDEKLALKKVILPCSANDNEPPHDNDNIINSKEDKNHDE